MVERGHHGLSSGNPDAAQIDLGELEFGTGPEPELKPKRAVEDTKAVLAFTLAGLTGLVVVGLFVVLALDRINADEFQKLAGLMLGPLVGLLGAATGYYYGKSSGGS